jgi:hypothetical protein
LRYWIKSSFVDLDGWKNGWFWFVWSGGQLAEAAWNRKQKNSGYCQPFSQIPSTGGH